MTPLMAQDRVDQIISENDRVQESPVSLQGRLQASNGTAFALAYREAPRAVIRGGTSHPTLGPTSSDGFGGSSNYEPEWSPGSARLPQPLGSRR
jgi:hypothetical protein